MAGFEIGDEVLFDGEIYVISATSDGFPYRYRLLASRRNGTRILWVDEGNLSEIDSYHRSLDDTARY